MSEHSQDNFNKIPTWIFGKILGVFNGSEDADWTVPGAQSSDPKLDQCLGQDFFILLFLWERRDISGCGVSRSCSFFGRDHGSSSSSVRATGGFLNAEGVPANPTCRAGWALQGYNCRCFVQFPFFKFDLEVLPSQPRPELQV